MNLEISWSRLAENELENIEAYYAPRAGFRITTKLINGILKTVFLLGDNPYMDQKEERLSHKEKSFRYSSRGITK